ncbi:hypothetical protein E2C01_030833 [Portunus trituberculatus]|uniref:Uncharacterized protein n=1 Tax=Portunus trituberculatus TaxID=210409 RepID=A0A5B7EWD7_PORTR|nr:hypothetical protein [Portunus trituberculatus]
MLAGLSSPAWATGRDRAEVVRWRGSDRQRGLAHQNISFLSVYLPPPSTTSCLLHRLGHRDNTFTGKVY